MFDRTAPTKEDARISHNAVPRSDSPVRDQVCFLEEQCKALHAGYDVLEERLSAILRPVPPNVSSSGPRGENEATQSNESHLVQRLRVLNDAFTILQQRIASLHGRVEL